MNFRHWLPFAEKIVLIYKKNIFSIIQIFFTFLGIGFLFFVIKESFPRINFQDIKFNLPLLITSLTLVSLAIILWALIWSIIVKSITINKNNLSQIINIYIFSNLTKYLPGSFWNYLMRDIYGKSEGIESKRIWLVNYIEILGSIISGTIIYLFSLLYNTHNMPLLNPKLLILIVIFFLFLISPPWVNFLFAKFPIISRKVKNIKYNYDWILFIKFVLLSILNWIIVCFGVYIFMSSVITLPPESIPEIFGIWSISIVIGLLAFGVPQGIGVRDSLLIFLLSPLLGSSFALVIAILSRLWLLCCDVLSFLIWLFIKQISFRIIHKNY